MHRKLFLITALLISPCLIVASSTWKSKRSLNLASQDTLSSESLSKPNLLFSKKFLNTVFGVGWKVEVEYQIYNVGDAPAIDVQVDDEDFYGQNSTFEVIEGEATFRVGKILPGQNVTFNMTAMPNDLTPVGVFQFEPAKVTYRSGSGDEVNAEEEIVGWSSLFPYYRGRIDMLSKLEADRIHGPKMFAFLIFIFMLILPIGVPLFMYRMHKRKYDNLQKVHDALKAMKKMRRNK